MSTEGPVDVKSAIATGVNEDFEKIVGEYVSDVITKAADTLKTERRASLGNQNVIVKNFADDITSKLADTAVTESLSNVSLDSNINQSAIHKDTKNFMVKLSLELLAEKFIAANLLPGHNC